MKTKIVRLKMHLGIHSVSLLLSLPLSLPLSLIFTSTKSLALEDNTQLNYDCKGTLTKFSTTLDALFSIANSEMESANFGIESKEIGHEPFEITNTESPNKFKILIGNNTFTHTANPQKGDRKGKWSVLSKDPRTGEIYESELFAGWLFDNSSVRDHWIMKEHGLDCMVSVKKPKDVPTDSNDSLIVFSCNKQNPSNGDSFGLIIGRNENRFRMEVYEISSAVWHSQEFSPIYTKTSPTDGGCSPITQVWNPIKKKLTEDGSNH